MRQRPKGLPRKRGGTGDYKGAALILPIPLLLIIMAFLLYFFSGVNYNELLILTIFTMATPWILMGFGLFVLALWYDKLSYFIKHAIWFLCFNYNKNSNNQYDKYWPIKYFFISALYFFIFAIFFFFSGFEDISHVIFLSWFGVMAIRLLHFVPGSYNTCKLLGEILFSTLIPFGILLEIGLLMFKKYVIVWEGMIVYIIFSIMFILSVLLTEILLVFFIKYSKKNEKSK